MVRNESEDLKKQSELLRGIDKYCVACLEKDDFGVQYQTIMLMVAIVKGPPQARANTVTANKMLLMKSEKLRRAIIDRLRKGLVASSGELLVQAIMAYLAYCTIKPYSDTTHPDNYKTVLGDLTEMGEALFRIFLHPSAQVVSDASLMMEVITRDSPPDVKVQIQSAAVLEGALLKHLHLSLFANTYGEKKTSRTLVAMWCDCNAEVQDLLTRVLPLGLLLFLDTPPDTGSAGRGGGGSKKERKRHKTDRRGGGATGAFPYNP